MSTWARTSTGDMLLPPVGQGAQALVHDENEACAIKLADRLQFLQGEWFLDTRQGFPWQAILGKKNPPIVAVRQLLRKTILSTPPIISVEDVDLTFDRTKRAFVYSFTAKTNSGATITGGSGVPFVVQDSL